MNPTRLNVRCEFEDGSVIDLKGPDCTLVDDSGHVLVFSREKMLRFVHTFTSDVMERACGDRIGSCSYVFSPDDEQV